ncbi:hypothetical protein IIA79_08745 [bacterium]|nr:hypothetical protein [bacterium]
MPSVPPDPYAPQLALTYHNGQLTRIYNHYRPDDDKQPLPRFFVEALPGVKCGNRRSDFVTALGGETDRMRPDEWRFDAKDGRMIAVMAKFTRVEAVGEDLCSSLTITLAPAVSGGRGEKFDNKKDWRDILK